MPSKLYEDELARVEIAKRRGVFTTWGAPCTWGACLVRSPDIIKSLVRCPSVISIEDVADTVLQGRFTPPSGNWSLLLGSPHQDWYTFTDNLRYNEALDALRNEFDGDVLRTGAVDDYGTVYVRLWQNGSQTPNFVTDGMGWPPPPEDLDFVDEDDENGEIFLFESQHHTDQDWPHQFSRVEEAHQQLIIDQDAYVSGVSVEDGKLCAFAGHAVATEPQNITSVLLVRLG